jgi:hypothetical protein
MTNPSATSPEPDRHLTRAVQLRLVGAAIALAAGTAALVVAILLVRTTRR